MPQLVEREVLGDECAAEGCPYEHEGGSKWCSYHQNGKGLCEDCGIQLAGDDVGYCTCMPCFKSHYAGPEVRQAAEAMDWQQVVLNGGPPCFHLENQRFCGRAQRWQGHDSMHHFVSLADLLRKVRDKPGQAAQAR